MQTNISPVTVYPGTANVLYVRAGNLGPPPSYYYQLQNVTEVEKTREVANPDYVPESVDADGNAVPPQGTPTITETYTEQVVVILKDGNVGMTQEQWDGWSDSVDDDDYQLTAIAANLNLTRA